jgi:hypothetical protein
MATVITNTLGQNDEKNLIELSSKLKTKDLCNVKVPYIVKDKLFIGPGTWNNFYYSPEELDKSFLATDWELKENRHLFLDHDDQKVSSWVGMVENMYMDNEHNLRGDLVIVDLPTARKLEMGAKFGISCKLGGEAANGAMTDFTYTNHSIVVTPAVKTAYINNSELPDNVKGLTRADIEKFPNFKVIESINRGKQGYYELLFGNDEYYINDEGVIVWRSSDNLPKDAEKAWKEKTGRTISIEDWVDKENKGEAMSDSNENLAVVTAMEAKRKELKMSVDDFYAIPRDPPSASKLPIFDADHVRNALARFGQVKDVTDAEKAKAKTKIRKAAKKFGIKTELSEEINDSQNKQLEVDTMSEITEQELEDIVMNSEWTDFVKKMRAAHPGMGFKEIAKKFKESKVEEKPKAEDKKDEPVENKAEVSKEMSDLISKLSAKLDSIDAKLSDTDKKLTQLEEAKEEDKEEPATDEPAKDEPAKEESTEDPVKAEPVEEEPKAEDVKEEPVKDESVTEEPAKEEPVAEEPAKDEPVKDAVSDEVVENKSKVVKEMSEEKVEKVMVPVESSKQTTETKLSIEDCDTAIHKAMLVIQGNPDMAKQL